MNTYGAFFKGQQTVVKAETLWQAKQEAWAYWKVPEKQKHQVTVMLMAKDGIPVVHVADF